MTVRDVNDILYDYTVDVAEKPRAIDDFAAFKSAVNPNAQPLAGDPCRVDEARGALNEASTAILALQPRTDKNGDYESIPVKTTIAGWQRDVAPHAATARALQRTIVQNLSKCADPIAARAFLNKEFPEFDSRIAAIEHRIASPHIVETPITIRADADYTVTVTERYQGAVTANGSKAITFSPASTVLTLSAGFGATTLEGRAYAARTTPGANAADPVQTRLEVSGLGNRPVLSALLNYEIPGATRGDYGLTVSSGPVFAFSSGTTNTASLGVFFGISGHLFRRFFITPGLHLGEFADTPAGFSGDGALIPDKFGALVPRKQWKTKFAIMFTYRTADLSRTVPKPKVEDAPAKDTKEEKKTDKKDGGGSWL